MLLHLKGIRLPLSSLNRLRRLCYTTVENKIGKALALKGVELEAGLVVVARIPALPATSKARIKSESQTRASQKRTVK